MKRFTVLVAEDETKILEAETILLRELGCTVLPTENASLVFDMFTSNKVDLCIFDLMMPGLSKSVEGSDNEAGFILTGMIRSVSPDVPVIIVTGKEGDNEHVERAKETYGVTEYVKKPISRLGFLELVMRTLAASYPNEYADAKMSLPDNVLVPEENDDIHLSPAKEGVYTEGGVCSFNGKSVNLSNFEFGVLWTLRKNKGHLMTVHQIYSEATGNDSPRDAATQVMIAVNGIKLKISDDIISEKKGLGYRYNG